MYYIISDNWTAVSTPSFDDHSFSISYRAARDMNPLSSATDWKTITVGRVPLEWLHLRLSSYSNVIVFIQAFLCKDSENSSHIMVLYQHCNELYHYELAYSTLNCTFQLQVTSNLVCTKS